jgi:hypothetical protein
MDTGLRAFSSEVETGSREENASNIRNRASVPIQSERKRLQAVSRSRACNMIKTPFENEVGQRAEI